MKRRNFRFWMVFAIAINLSWIASAQTQTLDISSYPLWTDYVTILPNSCRTDGFRNKSVMETSIKAECDSLDLSKLPIGEYRVRHGHKAILIKKN